MNNRSKLVIALGTGALAAPLGAFVQRHGKVWCIGIVCGSPTVFPDAIEPFRQGFRDLGYAQGRPIAIEYR